MADGVAQERWNHTALLLATLCELQRNPKRRPRPFTADEFHPYLRTRRRGTPLTGELIRVQARKWFAERSGVQSLESGVRSREQEMPKSV